MRVGGESSFSQYHNEIVLSQNDMIYTVVENSFEFEDIFYNGINHVILSQYVLVTMLARARFPAKGHRYLHSRMITNSTTQLRIMPPLKGVRN